MTMKKPYLMAIENVQMMFQRQFPVNIVLYSLLICFIMNLSPAVLSQNVGERAAHDDVISAGAKAKVPGKIVHTPAKMNGSTTPIPKDTSVNCSLPKNANLTICKDDDTGMVQYFLKKMSSNSGMLFRTMYVLLAVTGIVILYFVVKAIRLRRRRSKSRKYGIITKHGDHGEMEMEPLGDGNDEDDDYTVFEMNRRK